MGSNKNRLIRERMAASDESWATAARYVDQRARKSTDGDPPGAGPTSTEPPIDAQDEVIARRKALMAHRLTRATVAVVIKYANGSVYVGSGVLVRLGGVEFVLTAAHNLWDDDADTWVDDIRISSALPGPEVVPQTPARSFSPLPDSRGKLEPDVAVLELRDPSKLRSDREPFEEEDIGFLPSSAPARALILAGVPAASAKVLDRLTTEQGDERLKVSLTTLALHVFSIPDRRAAHEPPEGRGVHVFVGRHSAPDDQGVVHAVPDLKGMSGGPLMLGRGTLVGLARSKSPFEDGDDEWCEPVVEAIRALTNYGQSTDVALAARRIVRRCDTESSSGGLVSVSLGVDEPEDIWRG